MGFLSKVGSAFEKFYNSINGPINDSRQAIVRNYLLQDSITCKCGGLAVPVYNTSNKYLCLKCCSRFANARHHITSNIQQHKGITQISYDRVITQLLDEEKGNHS